MGSLFQVPKLYTLATTLLLFMLVNFTTSLMNTFATNDNEFEGFLIQVMNNYTAWLKNSNLDPSQPTEDTVSFQAYRLIRKADLNCEIFNQFVRGHSQTAGDTPWVQSDFAQHEFGIGRTVNQNNSYELLGNLYCSGAMNHTWYEELSTDLPFNVQGQFLIKVNTSREFLGLKDVGITENLKLDLTHAVPFVYFFAPIFESVELKGYWNDTRFNAGSEYIGDVEVEFGFAFYARFVASTALTNPSGHILRRYFNEIAETVQLTDIIKEGELPKPYDPSITTTTTTTTSASTTTLGTTLSTSSTTTPTSESSGESILTKTNLAGCTVIMIMTLLNILV